MFTALASLSLLLAVAPAVTQGPAAATARVHVSDLNLHTTAGRAELDRRLRRAVGTVCPAGADSRDLRRIQQTEACRTAALATVTKQRHSALAAAGVPANEIASNGR
jgi:UrcA family protein